MQFLVGKRVVLLFKLIDSFFFDKDTIIKKISYICREKTHQMI